MVRRYSSGNGGHKVNEKTRSSIANSGPIVWYLGMINARPILTKSITSTVIYSAADLTSQVLFLVFVIVVDVCVFLMLGML